MERQERGKIINIASINGQNPAALVCVYNTEFIICKTKSISFDTKFIIFHTNHSRCYLTFFASFGIICLSIPHFRWRNGE